MKLKRTSFYAAYPEGLVKIKGHAFEVNGRELVVHRARESNREFDDYYYASEKSTGFKIKIPATKSRAAAVSLAIEAVSAIPQEKWDRAMKGAAERRSKLKILGEE